MLTAVLALPLAWWLVGSFLLSIMAANTAWRLCDWTTGPGRHLGRLVRVAHRSSPLRALGGFVYNVGIPYGALLLGILDPRLVGLTGYDWVQSLEVIVGITVLCTTFLWLHARRMGCPSPPPHSMGAPPLSVPVTLWLVLFRQAHWTFYRAGMAAWLGAYSGAFAGLGLVLLEWILNPFWRQAWQDEANAPGLTFDLALILTTTVVAVLTGNLWACVLVHGALALMWRSSAYGRSVAWPSAEDTTSSW